MMEPISTALLSHMFEETSILYIQGTEYIGVQVDTCMTFNILILSKC